MERQQGCGARSGPSSPQEGDIADSVGRQDARVGPSAGSTDQQSWEDKWSRELDKLLGEQTKWADWGCCADQNGTVTKESRSKILMAAMDVVSGRVRKDHVDRVLDRCSTSLDGSRNTKDLLHKMITACSTLPLLAAKMMYKGIMLYVPRWWLRDHTRTMWYEAPPAPRLLCECEQEYIDKPIKKSSGKRWRCDECNIATDVWYKCKNSHYTCGKCYDEKKKVHRSNLEEQLKLVSNSLPPTWRLSMCGRSHPLQYWTDPDGGKCDYGCESCDKIGYYGCRLCDVKVCCSGYNTLNSLSNQQICQESVGQALWWALCRGADGPGFHFFLRKGLWYHCPHARLENVGQAQWKVSDVYRDDSTGPAVYFSLQILGDPVVLDKLKSALREVQQALRDRKPPSAFKIDEFLTAVRQARGKHRRQAGLEEKDDSEHRSPEDSGAEKLCGKCSRPLACDKLGGRHHCRMIVIFRCPKCENSWTSKRGHLDPEEDRILDQHCEPCYDKCKQTGEGEEKIAGEVVKAAFLEHIPRKNTTSKDESCTEPHKRELCEGCIRFGDCAGFFAEPWKLLLSARLLEGDRQQAAGAGNASLKWDMQGDRLALNCHLGEISLVPRLHEEVAEIAPEEAAAISAAQRESFAAMNPVSPSSEMGDADDDDDPDSDVESRRLDAASVISAASYLSVTSVDDEHRCFLGHTVFYTPGGNGFRLASELELYDRVFSATGTVLTVMGIRRAQERRLVELRAGDASLTVTSSHHVMSVRGQQEQRIPAEHLRPGDIILCTGNMRCRLQTVTFDDNNVADVFSITFYPDEPVESFLVQVPASAILTTGHSRKRLRRGGMNRRGVTPTRNTAVFVAASDVMARSDVSIPATFDSFAGD